MKLRSVTLLVIAEILGMSLWFVSAAVLGDMSREMPISDALGAALTSSISAGFVIGALTISITGIADRFDPRFVFCIAASLAASANLLVLFLPTHPWVMLILRFAIGVTLAGVYPVGMKIVVGWGVRDRGMLVGLLVGGLTIGTAAPHLLSFIGGSDWRTTTIIASLLAFAASILVLFTKLGPHHAKAVRFQVHSILVAWKDKRIRLALGGYFGHNWELYAMWAWISTALTVSFSAQTDEATARELAKITTFVAIAVGALMCPIAGLIADAVGKARITIIAMTISCAAALGMAVVFNGPIWLVACVAIVWGFSIIPDSAQFSALIADYAPAELTGSIMTLQTALGFALTVVSVQGAAWVSSLYGWPVVFIVLAIGPFAGVFAMLRLQNATRHES